MKWTPSTLNVDEWCCHWSYEVKKYYIIFVKSSVLHIFYKQPNFPVELRVAIERAQNQAKDCYEVASDFRLL